MFTRTQIAAAVTAVVFVAAGLYLYDHSPPMKFVEGHVSPEIAHPAQPISVSITLDWTRLCELDVSRIMRDGAGDEHKLPWSKSSPPPKTGRLVSVRQIIVPAEAKYGKSACYRASIYMQCGILDKLFPIKVEVPCIPFEIAPKP
jgi:hypothetical protein